MTHKINKIHNYTKGVILDILIDCFTDSVILEQSENINCADISVYKKINIDAHEKVLKQVDDIMHKIEKLDLMKFVSKLSKEVDLMILQEPSYKLYDL